MKAPPAQGGPGGLGGLGGAACGVWPSYPWTPPPSATPRQEAPRQEATEKFLPLRSPCRPPMTFPSLRRSASPAPTSPGQPPRAAETGHSPRHDVSKLGFVLCHSIEIAIP